MTELFALTSRRSFIDCASDKHNPQRLKVHVPQRETSPRAELRCLSIPAITKTRGEGRVRLTYNGLVHEGLRLRIVEEERPRPPGQDDSRRSQQDGLQGFTRRAAGQVL